MLPGLIVKQQAGSRGIEVRWKEGAGVADEDRRSVMLVIYPPNVTGNWMSLFSRQMSVKSIFLVNTCTSDALHQNSNVP